MNNLLTSLEDYEMYGVKIVDATALRATTLGELGNFDFSSIINKNGIDDVKVGALLGYEYDDAAGKWKNDEMMNAIEKALADKKLSELTGETLEKVIDDLKVVDVLGSDSNVMKILPPDTTVGNIDSAIKTAINTKSIGDLMNAGFIDIAAENQTRRFGRCERQTRRVLENARLQRAHRLYTVGDIILKRRWLFLKVSKDDFTNVKTRFTRRVADVE